jgi:hypothetical protein
MRILSRARYRNSKFVRYSHVALETQVSNGRIHDETKEEPDEALEEVGDEYVADDRSALGKRCYVDVPRGRVLMQIYTEMRICFEYLEPTRKHVSSLNIRAHVCSLNPVYT